MAERLWWQKQMRMVQYNLQSKDTPLMDAVKIAEETRVMGANVAVINVTGGGAAFYRSDVPFHHAHDFLPEGRDILTELIEECHKRDIKVVARWMLSAFEEDVYFQRPQWVRRKPDGSPFMLGNDRPGLWRRLYAACPNSGFQLDEVGIPAFRETLERYDIDGVFGVGGFSGACWCETCKKLYRDRYGKEMSADKKDLEPDFWPHRMDEQLKKYRVIMDELMPNKPFIRYYWPFDLDLGIEMGRIPADNIDVNAKQCNVLCTEAQNVLSLGVKKLPEWATPALRMKMGRTIKDYPPPVGIIHACPGMDWRHACLPVAEFMYWAAQIPANGGSYWTTFTGFNDTVTDKRMIRAVEAFNKMTNRIVEDMDGAQSAVEVLLLSDGGPYVQGWAEALFCQHIDFDMLAHYQFSYDRIKDYNVVIVPKQFKYPAGAEEAFARFVSDGGRLIVEGTSEKELAPVIGLLNTNGPVVSSEELAAAYITIEGTAGDIQERLQGSGYLPLRGKVGLYQPAQGADVLLTWVPPFSPVEFAGLPPERASLPAAHTDVPLCAVHSLGLGKVMFISFELSLLVRDYGLQDHYDLLGALVDRMLDKDKVFYLNAPQRVMMTVFGKGGKRMVHLVNGIGQRPLQDTIPCHDIQLGVKLGGRQFKGVTSRIAGLALRTVITDDMLTIHIPRLDVWDMLLIEFAQ